jgi:hypothetical protein
MRNLGTGSGMKGLGAGTYESGTIPGAKLGLYFIYYVLSLHLSDCEARALGKGSGMKGLGAGTYESATTPGA